MYQTFGIPAEQADELVMQSGLFSDSRPAPDQGPQWQADGKVDATGEPASYTDESGQQVVSGEVSNDPVAAATLPSAATPHPGSAEASRNIMEQARQQSGIADPTPLFQTDMPFLRKLFPVLDDEGNPKPQY